MALESAGLEEVVSATRFLAKPGRRKRSIADRVDVLLAALKETTVFEKISRDTGLDLSELIRLLKAVANGQGNACDRLAEVAASIAPQLTIKRGPKVTAPSVSHQFFLEVMHMRNEPCGYSLDHDSGKCLDREAEATRREFDLLDFDPRPAYRRLKAQRDTH